MRKALLGLTLAVSLFVPSVAQAAFPTDAFNGAVNCTVQNAPAAVAGQVWCGGALANPQPITTAPSFDNTPIDVAFYAPGTAGPYPVIGVYHGYNGNKVSPASASDTQRWISRGYAVFTMTARGFRGSCGPQAPQFGTPACANGYIHLMSAQFEVRDAQHMLAKLADDNAIVPKQIGAVGQSYGSGLSAQLGALKNRVMLADGTLAPWKSTGGKDLEIAATAPEFGWSDLAYSLVPNGSTLDYAAFNPYRGPAGQPRRNGVQKAAWTESLYFSPLGGGTGSYCGIPPYAPCNDPRFNVPLFRGTLGGANPGAPDATSPAPPYDGNAVITNALDELSNFHSSYGIDDSVAPAPSLLSNGWNDDLFPVDEAVRYYNKVREKYPDNPINLWAFDWGHPMRTAINTDNATSLFAAEGRWMDFYIRGIGSAPEDAAGGVNTIASGCSDDSSAATPTSTAIVHADDWASLSKGELVATDPAAKQISASAQSLAPFQTVPASNSVTVCTTAADTDIAGLAYYTIPAQNGDYTITGSPTIKLDLTTGNVNDALLARLYDVNVAANNRRLIARGALRPYGTQPGKNTQIFQLHPQQWRVAAGHTLKLELLAQDVPYARRTSGQSNLTVENVELRVPTLDAPAGAIRTPAAKDLPAGYVLARDFRQETPTPTPTPTPTATAPYTVPTPTATPYYNPPPPETKKKKPGLTLKVKPKRDKTKPFKFTAKGKLDRKGVAKGKACKGKVVIRVNKGHRKGKIKVKVNSSCKYKKKITLNKKKAGNKGKAKFKAQFLGNNVLKKSNVKKKTVKYGKKAGKSGSAK